eukprot:GHVS01050744.1.p2 GENE.GHVS01050744.1~~GHVS01050744.1.p2  ORF type:complete len:130 (-),score=25.53 GHVS01050744.1:441-830(-)
MSRPSPVSVRHSEAVKEGWLSKQSKYLKEWHRRWVVLTPDFICSFRDQGSLLRGSNPTEFLRLCDCSTVQSADDDVHKQHAFRVDTPDRVFYLTADSNADKEAWIGHIGRQMVRPTAFTEPYGGSEDGR